MKPWNDPALPATVRADALIAEMTLREKVAQLYGVWAAASSDGRDVEPVQHEDEEVVDLDDLVVYGLGQLTRTFGSAPVDPTVAALSLAHTQQKIIDSSRFGIPAIAHEECLSGFTAWGATCYPVPLAWGATFDPELVERMAQRIGASMRAVGVHQGLAPVLDVTRDYRWGRVEETIGEDPQLVARTATAYVRGLEAAGIVSTLKHFVGYSTSRAGRNLGPVSVGPRELADVLELPFEMAIRDGGARSVMNSYTDIDGVPVAADASLLTGTLRDTWGFTGTVVSDYGAVLFLKTAHKVAATEGEAAALALRAGIDVELPTIDTYAEPLMAEIEAGRIDECYVDRALRRVLIQKVELGLLDPGWSALPPGLRQEDTPENAHGRITLDTAEDRQLAREVAARSVVLVSNGGTLPVTHRPRRIAVIGPSADDPMVLVGCYAFPNHVLDRHPEVPLGIDMPTVAEAVRAEFPVAEIITVSGVSTRGTDTSEIETALRVARDADIVVAAVGDRAGLSGRGTSGEGCDADSLELPGRQWELLDALLDTSTPVVITLITGRPYLLHDAPERAAAIVQAFFPGEEGAAAIAGVLSGRVNPSGRLPVSIPATGGAQPSTYLAAPLAALTSASNIDPTPRFAFGHGLSYSSFEWTEPTVTRNGAPTSDLPSDSSVTLTMEVVNISDLDGVDVVQIYLHDPVASVTLPSVRMIAFESLVVPAHSRRQVTFELSADLTSFTGVDLTRIVEPGAIELRVATSSADVRYTVPLTVTGPLRHVDHTRTLAAAAAVTRVEGGDRR